MYFITFQTVTLFFWKVSFWCLVYLHMHIHTRSWLFKGLRQCLALRAIVWSHGLGRGNILKVTCGTFPHCFAVRTLPLNIPCLSTLWFQNRLHPMSPPFRLFVPICFHFQLLQPGQRTNTPSFCQVWLHWKGSSLKYEFLDKGQCVCLQRMGVDGALVFNFSGLVS